MDLAGNCRLGIWPIYAKTVCDETVRRDARVAVALLTQVDQDHSDTRGPAAELNALEDTGAGGWAGVSLGQVANVKKRLEDRECVSPGEGFRLAARRSYRMV